jgi:hypothetical protein
MRRVLATPQRGFSESHGIGQSGKRRGKEKGGTARRRLDRDSRDHANYLRMILSENRFPLFMR